MNILNYTNNLIEEMFGFTNNDPKIHPTLGELTKDGNGFWTTIDIPGEAFNGKVVIVIIGNVSDKFSSTIVKEVTSKTSIRNIKKEIKKKLLIDTKLSGISILDNTKYIISLMDDRHKVIEVTMNNKHKVIGLEMHD
jgi:hypothetical protein